MAALDETKIIDRVAEEEIFARMLQFQTARRVMIVSDGRGRGKTDLLRKLRYVCSYLQEVPVALVDLEVHRVGEEFDIAQTIRNQLAQGGVEFKGFDDLDQARSHEGNSSEPELRVHRRRKSHPRHCQPPW